MATQMLVIAVLITVSLQASIAVKDSECLKRCLSQQVSCSGSCGNFLFGPEVCHSICSSWGIRCQTNCPEVAITDTDPVRRPNVLARINCLSVYSNGQLLRCPVPQASPDMNLRLVISRRLTMFDCTQGVNYGLAPDNSYIWTSGGCSAEFFVIRIDGSSSMQQQQQPSLQSQQPRPPPPLPQQTVQLPQAQPQPQPFQPPQPLPPQPQQPVQPPQPLPPQPQQPVQPPQPLPPQPQQPVQPPQPLPPQPQQPVQPPQPLPPQPQQPVQPPQPLPPQPQQPVQPHQPLPPQPQQPALPPQPLPPQPQQPVQAPQPFPPQPQQPVQPPQPYPPQQQEPTEPQQSQPGASQTAPQNTWTEWGSCSVTCNQGRQSRSRLRACASEDTQCVNQGEREYELRTCISQQCEVQDESLTLRPEKPPSSESAGQGSASSQSASQGPAQFKNQATCGRANFNRVVGGTRAGRCEYPWMVLIYNQVTHKICGGSIIGSKEILTASHCLFGLDESTRQYEKALEPELIIFSGSSTMPLANTFPERGLRRNYVQNVITHPEYRPSNARNDIAILKLRRPLPDDDCHRPVCLVSGQEDQRETRGCRTMGWGKTTNHPDGEATNRLMWTGVTIRSHEECRNIYGGATANTATLCAGGKNADSCSGDSGGPLVCRGDDGAFYQHGVVSLGLEGQCGRVAGLYTSVAHFMSWITATVLAN